LLKAPSSPRKTFWQAGKKLLSKRLPPHYGRHQITPQNLNPFGLPSSLAEGKELFLAFFVS
jgi:hypothetical protein